MNLTTAKKVLTILNGFKAKNYLSCQDNIQRNLERVRKAKEAGSDLYNEYTEADVIRLTKKDFRNVMFKNVAVKLHELVQQKDENSLYERLWYDQLFSRALFELYTGIKLKKTNKEAFPQIEKFCKES